MGEVINLIILNSLLPVFFILGMGYYAGYRKQIDNLKVATLNLFVMNYALPSALFIAISKTPQDVIFKNGPLMLVLTLCLLSVYVVTMFLQFRFFKVETGKAAVQTLTVALPNFASIGLPLLGAVYGPTSAVSVAIAIAVGSVTVSPLTLVFLESATSEDKSVSRNRLFWRAISRTLKRPIFLAPMTGLVIALAGVHLPEVAGRCLNLIGAATGGAALFLTGLILSAQKFSLDKDILLGVFFKNILQPILAYGLVRALGVPEPFAGQTVLLIAIPCGFFGAVFGAGHGVRNERAGSTLILSTLLSIVTLTIVIMLVAPPPS